MTGAHVHHPAIGVCGLSCRLCPRYHTRGHSRCAGCKSATRVAAGCPFITCAVKRKGIEYCGECHASAACPKWAKHRDFGKRYDTFTCYQNLEANITFIAQHGMPKFDEAQQVRERLLEEMLTGFNEGRSKRYYCIAATVLDLDDLARAVTRAREQAQTAGLRERSHGLHATLDAIADQHSYSLKLRTRPKP